MTRPHFACGFKIDASKRINERGYFVAEVSKRLGVSTHSLYAWQNYPLCKRAEEDAGQYQPRTITTDKAHSYARVTGEMDQFVLPGEVMLQNNRKWGSNQIESNYSAHRPSGVSCPRHGVAVRLTLVPKIQVANLVGVCFLKRPFVVGIINSPTNMVGACVS